MTDPSFAAGRLHPDALSGAAGLLAGHGHRDSSSAVLAARRALTPAKHIRPASPVTPEQIDYAFEKAGANYGGANHAELLAASLLKVAAGYYCSHVITVIAAAPGDTLRLPGPLSTPSPYLYDYAPRLNHTP